MNSNILKEGQTLKLYTFKNQQMGIMPKQAIMQPLQDQFVQVKSMMEDGNYINISISESNEVTDVNEYIYHRLGEKESIADIVDQYGDVTIEDIIELNGLTKDNVPMPGDLIMVKPKSK